MSRKDEIIEAAQSAFLKYGIQKITLEDIAKECGIKKTALYYYFKNKEEILSAMIISKISSVFQEVEAAIEAENDVKSCLRAYMHTRITMMMENLPFFKLMEDQSLPTKAKLFMKENHHKFLQKDVCLISDILRKGIKNKNISYEMNDSLVLMIMGVTYGMFASRMIEDTKWNIEAMIDTSIDVIFNGIGN